MSSVDTGLRQEGGLQDVDVEILHLVLNQIQSNKENFGLATEQKDAFYRTLRKGNTKLSHRKVLVFQKVLESLGIHSHAWKVFIYCKLQLKGPSIYQKSYLHII